MKFGFANRNICYATFRTQHLQNVTPGKKVTLTVKGTFNKGQVAQVQASDTIRVIDEGWKPPKPWEGKGK